MEVSQILGKIVPGIDYDAGFKIEGETQPYYSFCKPGSQDGCWSDEMARSLEEPSRTHFIDIYNRRLALDGIKEALDKKQASYLDIGCSSGYMIEDILRVFPRVEAVGADYFSEGLIQCHNRLSGVPLFQMDLLKCPFPDNLFDAITCLNVLEHIEDDISALRQLFRITKPGGRIVVTVPTGPEIYDIYDQIHGHCRRYKLSDLKKKVMAAGFTLEKGNYFAVFIYPAFFLVKQLNRLRYSQLSREEKRQIVFGQIKKTQQSKIMEKLCRLEYALGKNVRYLFGIRGYVIAKKCV